MSLSTAGVDSFLLQHPTYDGRGVLLLIFDTGVDMSIPGLQKTSTGLPKVIDAIDFSGSNVVPFERATLKTNSPTVATAPGLPVALHDIAKLDPQPIGNDIYISYIDESLYRNSSVRDFDGDGEAHSRFGALLYRSADGWRVVVDTDADSSLVGEVAVGSYRERQETFRFRQSGERTESPLTFAATIDTAGKRVSFHYDMGGHGTHVAGIASGFGINGESGFNGIAPGAQVISGKFSGDFAKDNTVTGSMKRAYEYAGHLADSLAAFHMPVVVNMSFGIGSALEGRADIERFIDDQIANHPNLYVVTSAGNEGPGISTVGIPASASRVIAVGALLPQGIGRDSYGAWLDQDIIWDFSSRGGEVAKPDVVAPGTAISTITRFAYESRASGTSMASPYTAGIVADLLSAMRQEDSTWVPTQELIRRALRYSARPIPGYALIEQGGGVVDLKQAYETLRRYRERGFADDIQAYNISTYSPNYPDEMGTTAFWRSNFVPGGDWRQTFTISRAGRDDAPFFRAYTLEPTAPWLRLVQNNVYIRNDGVATVDVVYDRDKMTEPGIYSASVIGRRASARGKASPEEVEFELVNTVIVPYRFSAEKEFTVTTPRTKLVAGASTRFYFAPPPGAAALTFTMNVPKGSRSNVSGSIVTQEGYTVNYLPRAKGMERYEASNTVAMSQLGDGIIEVVVQADAFEGNGAPSEFTLSVKAMMLEVRPEVVGYGNNRTLELEAINRGDEILAGSFNYTVKGYGRTVQDTMRGDTFTMPVVLYGDDGALWIAPTFSDEDYMRATDILVQIVDQQGNVQSQEAFNKPQEWLFLPNFDRTADSSRFTLRIIFGSANYEDLPDIPIKIIENHVRPTDPKPLGGFRSPDMVPYIPQHLEGDLTPSLAMIRPGYHGLGEVIFKPQGSDQSVTFEFEVGR
jgi:subtilisin family serine protease